MNNAPTILDKLVRLRFKALQLFTKEPLIADALLKAARGEVTSKYGEIFGISSSEINDIKKCVNLERKYFAALAVLNEKTRQDEFEATPTGDRWYAGRSKNGSIESYTSELGQQLSARSLKRYMNSKHAPKEPAPITGPTYNGIPHLHPDANVNKWQSLLKPKE